MKYSKEDLVFFYRSPAAHARIKLTPFWSYREAFSFEKGIVRLGVAREILMNILVYIPLGMILACLMKPSSFVSASDRNRIVDFYRGATVFYSHRTDGDG